MKIIDLNTFPRRSHYEFFKSYAYPYMGITANVDVTNLYNSAKEVEGSPFLAFLWAAATAANSVPELRQRIVNDQIVEYDHCDTAHTVALPDGTFVNCQTDCRRSFTAFLGYGKQCQEEAKQRHGFVQPGDDETQLIFVSSTPWITFTQVIQPTPMPADSNVRIVFGKFFDQNGRKLMPVNIQCNHALVDGFHVARFFQKFQELADSDLFAVPPDPSTDYGKYPTLAPLAGLPLGTAVEGEQHPGPERDDNAWRKNILRSDEISGYIGFDEYKDYYVFDSQYRRKDIKSVTFLDTLREMTGDAWDVSKGKKRRIMAWVKPNGTLYDLYIGAEGGMRTGANCRRMFAGYVNVERINFVSVLHTERAEDMSGMFSGCASLTELDLSGFDTSEVDNMCEMFSGCASLTKLDLSGFDTSEVQKMCEMFRGCASLTRLDLRSFDTTEVQNMYGMFRGCSSLTELELSSFDTFAVKNMGWMFSYCRSLTRLDLSNFDTSGGKETGYMFNRCPAGSAWKHLLH